MAWSSSRSRAISLRSRSSSSVAALVELLVALKQAALEVGQLLALGSGLLVGLARQLDLLVLGLKDQVLLLGAGLGEYAPGLVLRGT